MIKNKIRIPIFALSVFMLLTFRALAEVHLNDSGVEWGNYLPQEKQQLIKRICEHLLLPTDEKTINRYIDSVERFYNTYLQQCGGDKNNVMWKKCLNEPIMGIVFEISSAKTVPKFSSVTLNDAEKEVVMFMNYLQEMTYTGEYTEHIPKKELEIFMKSNITMLAKVYKVSPYDIHVLMLHAINGNPLPSNYRSPTVPDAKTKEWWNKKVRWSIDTCLKHSKHFTKENN